MPTPSPTPRAPQGDAAGLSSSAPSRSSACRVGCRLVGVEITDDATELPRFRHPERAAYVFGGERTSLSDAMLSAASSW